MERRPRRPSRKKLILGLGGVILCALLCLVPPPELLVQAAGSGSAMSILGITALAICWWAGEVAPNWVVSMVMMLLWVLLGRLPFATAFSGFTNTSLWLILGAFCLSASISKTGLFKRISWYLIRLFSPTFRGLSLALLLGGTVCSPLVPSSTAKAVLGASIAKGIADAMGYPPNSRGRCGLFLSSFIGFAGTSSAFLSGSIHTYMISSAVSSYTGSDIPWLTWLLYTLPWLIVVLIGSFFLIQALFSPESNAVLTPEYIRQECEGLGRMQKKESISALLLAAAVLLWIFEAPLHINSAVTALTVACLCFATGILEPAELATAVSWDLFIFMGGVVNLGNIFSITGIQTWLQHILQPVFASLDSPFLMAAVIAVTTLLLHLLLASQTATLAVLLAILFPVAVSSGIHPFAVGFVLLAMVQGWFFSYQNATFSSAFSIMRGTLRHQRTVGACAGFMLLSWLGCLAALLFWGVLGLI